MPNGSDTNNSPILQPGETAYMVVRSDGVQAIVIGRYAWREGDWFVVAMNDSADDRLKREACVFRPVAAMPLTVEQYETGDWE